MPFITFIGENGNSPYIFNYSINGQHFSTKTHNSQSSILLPIPTNQDGTFTFRLESVQENKYGCSNDLEDSVNIIIHPKPNVIFTPSPKEINETNNVVHFINHTEGSNLYFWDFGDNDTSVLTSPYHQFSTIDSNSFTITLTATNEFGCINTAIDFINVKEDQLFYIPNSFTPNNDEFNNEFRPILTDGFDLYDYQFTIFNRWGEIIFETNENTKGWDGHYKGKMVQDGVYSWVLKYSNKNNGHKAQITGHVTLIR